MIREEEIRAVYEQQPASRASARVEQNGDELALLVKVRLGDRKAFTELYHLYHPRLYGYIARLLPVTELVEEVVDDVMFVVWKDCRRFRGDSQLSTWIFGIAYRKSMKALQKEIRRRSRHDDALDPDELGNQPPTVDDAVHLALRRLSPEHRQVVVLTYFGGFAYKDIAQIANCPLNTVKTRMFYARRAMKAFLQDAERGGAR